MANLQNPIVIPPVPPGPIHRHRYTHQNNAIMAGDPIDQQEFIDAQNGVITFRGLVHTARAAGLHQFLIDQDIIAAWEEHQQLVAERQAAENLHTIIDGLIAAAAAAGPAPIQPQPQPQPGVHLAQIKVPQPDDFEGDQAKARDFIRTLEMYFTHPALVHLFPDGQSQVRFALTKLKDRALRWATPITTAFLTGGPLPASCRNWQTFQTLFGETFYNPHELEDNQNKWEELKHTTSVAQYCIDFNDLLARLEFNNHRCYQIGLYLITPMF
jgi:Retrotransposon gag protein